MNYSGKIILAGIGAALLFWCLHALLGWFLVGDGTYLDMLILKVPHSLIYFRIFSCLIILAVGGGVVWVVRSRQRTERALLEREHWFKTTLSSIGDAVIATDIEGRVTFMNQVASTLTGWPEVDAIGQPITDVFTIISEQSQKPIPSPIVRVLEEGAVVGLAHHTVLVARDGKRWPIDDSGAPIIDEKGNIIGAVLVIHDISDRRRAEKAVIRERDRAQHYLNIADVMLVSIAADETVTMINRKGCEVLGYHEDQIVGQNWFDLCLPENIRADTRRLFAQLISGTVTPTQHHETAVQTRSGDERIISWHNSLVVDDLGKIIATLSSGEDITERLQSEQALQESQRMLSTMMSNLPGMAYRCRNDKYWTMEFISEGCANVTGYSADDLTGNRQLAFADLILPEDRPHVWEEIQKALQAGGPFQLTYRIRTADDSQKWVWEQGRGVVNAAGKLVALEGVVNDISELKQAEQNLRESETRYRGIVHCSPIPILVHAGGKIVFVNQAAVTVLGAIGENDLLGRNVMDLVHPESRETASRRIRRVYEHKNDAAIIEERFVRLDGTVITVEVAASAIDFQGTPASQVVFRDISDRKKAELALRESEERFRTIFETARDAIFIKNSERRYLSINPATERLLGRPPEEIIGRLDVDIFDADEAQGLRESDERVLAGESLSEETALTVGSYRRILHISKVPLRDARGRIFGICGIARDITETRRLRELAERAQRLETAGRIAGQVAHDFNNLLGPLMAYPELIKEELPPDHPIIQYIEDIEKSAKQIADINMQLLTLGRRGHYNQEPLSLNDIIGQVIRQQMALPPQVAIDMELAEGLFNIQGGASQIFRMISNLLINAVESMTDGGRLTIKTENYYVDRRLTRFGRVPQGEYVKLTIGDTGSGISPDLLSKVFDPFFTTKVADKTKGSGLGLSVVHSVVDDHHGYIDLESVEGSGTTFYIYLPTTREDIVNNEDIKAPLGNNERILVVDDDAVQRDVTLLLLSRLGYIGVAVESGEKAVEELLHSEYDLLVLDMVMQPGIDGVETYRQALAIRPGQRAIIISGYAESSRVKEAHSLGAGEFVRKPLTLQVLAHAVRTQLDAERIIDNEER